MYEYKTVTYKEGTLNTMNSQNVDISKFSKVLNHYASKGWRVKLIEKDRQKSFWGGMRDAYLIILERKVS